jgi:hypothetical protein
MTPVQTGEVPDQTNAFAEAIDKFAPGFSQYLPTMGAGGTDWVDSIAKAASALAMTRQQSELLDVQIDRARRGLPPLDSSQYGLGATVGVSRDTIITAGVVLGGLVLLWNFSRKR